MIRRNFLTLIPFTFFLVTCSLQAQTLFTYGNKTVSKAEFLRAYNKNNTDDKPSDSAYRNYFDLFSKFKLKVQAAFDMKLDTLANLNAELQNFRSQVAENFLNDDGSMQELIDEAYLRGQKDIHVAHIFIPVRKEDSASQIQKAQNKINKAYELLKQRSFEQVALEYSEDPSVRSNKGDIGYITVFVLPYSIENIIYGTPAGQYSKPFRSAAGFHIFKNINERKAAGRLRAAQILVSLPPDATHSQKDSVNAKADSIITALRNGADFKKIALQYSNDNLSYQNGGELPEFGVGRYDAVFETAAFALQKDGELSKPVQTEFGYHIIKRLVRTPPQQDKSDRQWRDNIKQLIMQNDRFDISQKKLLGNIQKKTNFRKFPYSQNSLWRMTDSILANKKSPVLKDLNSNTALFAFAKQTIRVKDWQNYLESVRNIQSLVAGKKNAQIFEQFIETSSLDYYRNHLEEFNNDLVYQLNEFREGNLLFEVMQRKIWDAAAEDTVALKSFYQTNSNKYWWENSADAIIFTCSDETVAENLKASLKNELTGWRKLIETSNGSMQADSGRFELGQIPVLERTRFTPDLITASVKNEADNSMTFAYIVKLYNNREPRNFQDARGFVINDYQESLENQWIVSLKKKYPVKLNEAVFSTLPK
ncbi:MAG: peptidylprolyl isomerase [Chitinophagaceae bacterium]|nr:peptidylprolyl isomerase [Chitinophagaceae bacterium]